LNRTYKIHLLGRCGYNEARTYQNKLIAALEKEQTPQALILLEHPPLYTLGRRGRKEHLLISEKKLSEENIKLYQTDRGGDITFHGPGQLVAYPVLDLKKLDLNLAGYVYRLEQTAINAIKIMGIQGERLEGFPGVWVKGQKIAAVGVRINARHITDHGLAVNVNPRLDYFDNIIPCGLVGKKVTSLGKIMQKQVAVNDVLKILITSFEGVFGLNPLEIIKLENERIKLFA
jgi:lipoyl(octanoyl) transferase